MSIAPVRTMTALVARADSGLARQGAVNAARAVAEERARRRRWQREADDVVLPPLTVPVQRVTA